MENELFRKQAIAHHEAGHAVAALLVGVSFETVTIVQSGPAGAFAQKPTVLK